MSYFYTQINGRNQLPIKFCRYTCGTIRVTGHCAIKLKTEQYFPVPGKKMRENEDQNNSEYGHFLRSVHQEQFIHSFDIY